MSLEYDEEVLRSQLTSCERFLIVDDVERFVSCAVKSTGISWVGKSMFFLTGDGRLVRLVALFRAGDKVYSVLVFYKLDENLSYDGFDVDVSDVEDVRRFVKDV